MPRKGRRKHTAPESSTRARKRVKEEEATSEQISDLLQDTDVNVHHAPVQKKPNRLQRAVAKKLETKNTMTIAQARRIKRAAKQAGILAALLDAPVEIFCEVALYFSPLDLLNISRVSRQLRSFLLSKTNRNIWVTSLKSVDLPPCPEDLNEPQYASLVFDTDCNACGTSSVRSVHYELRVRLCKECFELNVVSSMNLLFELPFQYKSKNDCESMTSYLMKYFQFTEPIIPSCEDNPDLFYKPDLVDALEKCLSVFKNSDDFGAFLKECFRRKAHILLHAERMKEWEEAKKEERKSELLDLAGEHEKCVKAKLFELGYIDEDWTFHVFSGNYDDTKQWNKLVRQKRELTARTWKNLQPKLEIFLTSRRKKIRYTKRRNELKQAYIDYVGKLNLAFGELELLLSIEELFTKQPVKDLLDQDDSHQVITDEVWTAFIPTVEQLCEEYRNKTVAEHEACIIEWHVDNGKELTDYGDLHRITLASSFFNHHFQNLYYFNSAHSVITHLTSTLTHNDVSERPFFYGNCVLEIHYAIPDALLEALGLPLTTSMAFIQAMGRCFVCNRCDAAIQRPMGWTELVKHYIDEARLYLEGSARLDVRRNPGIKYLEDHSILGGGLVRKLSNEEMTLPSQEETATPSAAGALKCGLCCRLGIQKPGMSRIYVEAHIRSKHGRAASIVDIVEPINWILYDMDEDEDDGL